MTQQTRAVIRARFEQGDTPQGTDYSDWVDSAVFLADTTAQSLSSPLTIAGALGASTAVSAVAGEFTTVSANTIHASAATFTATVSAASIHAASAAFSNASAATFSANAVGITGSLTWTAEVTATTISTGTQTVPAIAAGYLVVNVCGQTVGVPYFKIA